MGTVPYSGGSTDTAVAERYCPMCDRSYGPGIDRCPEDQTVLVVLATPPDALIGRELDGRFTLKARLGVGGMGTVYRAWQHSVGREVAVKVMSARFAHNIAGAKRFLREAKLASRLTHPHTVTVLDFGQTTDGLLYLVMELVDGRTLGQVLQDEGPFSVARMVRVGTQLCDALEAAHRLSIIHRDLKPTNVMVLNEPAGRDHLKVLDFGLAKLLDRTDSSVTDSNAMPGTPGYIPPELYQGAVADARGDLYALGVILYELLAGRGPFDKGGTAKARLPSEHSPAPLDVAPVMQNVIFRLLERDPARRYSSAAQVREALLAASPGLGLPLPASTVGATRGAELAAAVIEPASRVRRWAVLAIAAVLIGAGATLAWKRAAGTGPSPAARAAPERHEAPAPEPPPAAAVAAPEAAKPAPADVEVVLLSSPAGASVTLAGVAAGRTPARVQVPRGSAPVEVVFRLDGRRAVRRRIIPDRAQTVEVRLVRAVRPGRPASERFIVP